MQHATWFACTAMVTIYTGVWTILIPVPDLCVNGCRIHRSGSGGLASSAICAETLRSVSHMPRNHGFLHEVRNLDVISAFLGFFFRFTWFGQNPLSFCFRTFTSCHFEQDAPNGCSQRVQDQIIQLSYALVKNELHRFNKKRKTKTQH